MPRVTMPRTKTTSAAGIIEEDDDDRVGDEGDDALRQDPVEKVGMDVGIIGIAAARRARRAHRAVAHP